MFHFNVSRYEKNGSDKNGIRKRERERARKRKKRGRTVVHSS